MGAELGAMLERMAGTLGGALEPLTFVVWVIGLIFFGAGLMQLRHVGKERASAPKCVANMGVGVLFLSIGTFIHSLSKVFFADAPQDLLSQVPSAGNGILDGYIRFATTLVIVVGFYCIIKGLIKLKDSSAGRGTMWSGLTHLLGGCVCCNIVVFAQMLGRAAGGTVQELVSKFFP